MYSQSGVVAPVAVLADAPKGCGALTYLPLTAGNTVTLAMTRSGGTPGVLTRIEQPYISFVPIGG